jgi:hypothetical protein
MNTLEQDERDAQAREHVRLREEAKQKERLAGVIQLADRKRSIR